MSTIKCIQAEKIKTFLNKMCIFCKFLLQILLKIYVGFVPKNYHYWQRFVRMSCQSRKSLESSLAVNTPNFVSSTYQFLLLISRRGHPFSQRFWLCLRNRIPCQASCRISFQQIPRPQRAIQAERFTTRDKVGSSKKKN